MHTLSPTVSFYLDSVLSWPLRHLPKCTARNIPLSLISKEPSFNSGLPCLSGPVVTKFSEQPIFLCSSLFTRFPSDWLQTYNRNCLLTYKWWQPQSQIQKFLPTGLFSSLSQWSVVTRKKRLIILTTQKLFFLIPYLWNQDNNCHTFQDCGEDYMRKDK